MKPCPFCAESIQEAAVKCRFCGSMLDGAAAAPAAPPVVFYEGSPSWRAWFWSYVVAGVLCVVLVGVVWMLALNAKRRSLRYKFTDHGIDYESGVFGKKIETLQLWRVQDVDFRQTFLERLLGVASIHIFTKDLTDPELVVSGLPASRELFDKLKDAAQLARQSRVVGLVT